MEEIKQLLQSWEDGDYINPDALKSAHEAISLLIERVEQLEAQVQSLTNP